MASPAPYRFSVLFDLDGTLHNDDVAVPLLVDAAAAHGYRFDGESVLKGERFVPRLQMELGIDSERAETVYATYVRMYQERAIHVARPLEYAAELIRSLHSQGVGLALVTHKLEAVARAVLRAFDVHEQFGGVFGADSLPHRKPDARVALAALERIGGQPQSAAIVGDTPADMVCGRDAGLRLVIGVLGTVTPSELRDSGATHVVSGLREVEGVLQRHVPASPFPPRGAPL